MDTNLCPLTDSFQRFQVDNSLKRDFISLDDISRPGSQVEVADEGTSDVINVESASVAAKRQRRRRRARVGWVTLIAKQHRKRWRCRLRAPGTLNVKEKEKRDTPFTIT